ncbi:hypothetical protein [Bacillus mycoides]|uniref:hypothetical protein n=1 Tax=Bacillus mycoides TaxID=1405 RepID=UPI001C0125C2|nr:hypothetical protein [Bacillus mycoides]QWH75885.1 hypothetical protein EXW59_03585 [Bacillus mycoides]
MTRIRETIKIGNTIYSRKAQRIGLSTYENRLMSELNIQSIIRKKRRFFKGNYSNVLNREFKDRQQNEALVTDISYLRFQEGFRYLSVVQDVNNNEVVSWKIPKYNDNELVLDTIEMSVETFSIQIRDSSTHLMPTTNDFPI